MDFSCLYNFIVSCMCGALGFIFIYFHLLLGLMMFLLLLMQLHIFCWFLVISYGNIVKLLFLIKFSILFKYSSFFIIISYYLYRLFYDLVIINQLLFNILYSVSFCVFLSSVFHFSVLFVY
jgi:hypothetical protein